MREQDDNDKGRHRPDGPEAARSFQAFVSAMIVTLQGIPWASDCRVGPPAPPPRPALRQGLLETGMRCAKNRVRAAGVGRADPVERDGWTVLNVASPVQAPPQERLARPLLYLCFRGAGWLA